MWNSLFHYTGCQIHAGYGLGSAKFGTVADIIVLYDEMNQLTIVLI